MRSYLLAAREKLGHFLLLDRVCCARVGREIHFLSTFETAPLLCECLVYTLAAWGKKYGFGMKLSWTVLR
jgi:hypothetical protein